MCIRDRCRAARDAPALSALVNMLFAAAAHPEAGDGQRAARFVRPDAQAKHVGAGAHALGEVGIAVSYTHLDVYKRQVGYRYAKAIYKGWYCRYRLFSAEHIQHMYRNLRWLNFGSYSSHGSTHPSWMYCSYADGVLLQINP